ncbi:MAG TPA: hypothetical protein ENN40_08425 [Candidatus Aminicenantes bacterium]|nr:hypothetical protein [Candidatus Aminicenantes bacterium]
MMFRPLILRLSAVFVLAAAMLPGRGLDLTFRGQFNAWLIGNIESALISQAGFQYIPELTLNREWGGGLTLDAVFSLDAGTTGEHRPDEKAAVTGDLEPYRLWTRLAGNRFEVRVGLQKINFGSATLFRPLMWFDHIDPRDPLKRTRGVKGLLFRYYFPGNANIWFWGLLGSRVTKGWETLPTPGGKIELGGRLQLPLPSGEAAFTYHHRHADLSGTLEAPQAMPLGEHRFALDCKLDVAVGLWFELAAIQRDTNLPLLRHQRMWTVGTDYTFAWGNGLHVLAEYSQTAWADRLFGSGEHTRILGLMMNYPIGLLDQVSGVYYWNPGQHNHYLWVNWQRTSDHWQFHFTLFLNPEAETRNPARDPAAGFSGNGFRVMVVFNH